MLVDLYDQSTLLQTFSDLVSDSSITVGELITALTVLQEATVTETKQINRDVEAIDQSVEGWTE